MYATKNSKQQSSSPWDQNWVVIKVRIPDGEEGDYLRHPAIIDRRRVVWITPCKTSKLCDMQCSSQGKKRWRLRSWHPLDFHIGAIQKMVLKNKYGDMQIKESAPFMYPGQAGGPGKHQTSGHHWWHCHLWIRGAITVLPSFVVLKLSSLYRKGNGVQRT